MDDGLENAGFFVDVRVFNASTAPAIIDKKITDCNDEETRGYGECGQDDSVDETQNLMLKLKFLPYKVILKKEIKSFVQKNTMCGVSFEITGRITGTVSDKHS